jgi:serine O-acetyltransferase
MRESANMQQLTEALLESYTREGGINHLQGHNLPSRDAIVEVMREIEALLFPGFYREEQLTHSNLQYVTGSRLVRVYEQLVEEVHRNLLFDRGLNGSGTGVAKARDEACSIVEYFFRSLPQLRDVLSTDVDALCEGDPAAQSNEEVILAYPGLRAIAVHRVANFLWNHGVRLIARMMSEYIHGRTGIDIHPGATIGRSFFIDHGSGVVIGETTRIGEHVKIYQGVTLGALSVRKDKASSKRHPTIQDRVTIYAGATILGGDTVIGHDSVIGGNVWLVKSVDPHSLVTSEASVTVKPSSAQDDAWYWEI